MDELGWALVPATHFSAQNFEDNEKVPNLKRRSYKEVFEIYEFATQKYEFYPRS